MVSVIPISGARRRPMYFGKGRTTTRHAATTRLFPPHQLQSGCIKTHRHSGYRCHRTDSHQLQSRHILRRNSPRAAAAGRSESHSLAFRLRKMNEGWRASLLTLPYRPLISRRSSQSPQRTGYVVALGVLCSTAASRPRMDWAGVPWRRGFMSVAIGHAL